MVDDRAGHVEQAAVASADHCDLGADGGLQRHVEFQRHQRIEAEIGERTREIDLAFRHAQDFGDLAAQHAGDDPDRFLAALAAQVGAKVLGMGSARLPSGLDEIEEGGTLEQAELLGSGAGGEPGVELNGIGRVSKAEEPTKMRQRLESTHRHHAGRAAQALPELLVARDHADIRDGAPADREAWFAPAATVPHEAF